MRSTRKPSPKPTTRATAAASANDNARRPLEFRRPEWGTAADEPVPVLSRDDVSLGSSCTVSGGTSATLPSEGGGAVVPSPKPSSDRTACQTSGRGGCNSSVAVALRPTAATRTNSATSARHTGQLSTWMRSSAVPAFSPRASSARTSGLGCIGPNFQSALQLDQAATDVALHCARRHLQPLGDLSMGEILVERHPQYPLRHLVQLRDLLSENQPFGDVERIGLRLRIGCQLILNSALLAPGLMRVDHLVAGYAKQPRGQAGAVGLIVLASAPRGDEDLLGDVLRFSHLTQGAQCDGVDQGGVPAIDRLQGRLVSGHETSYEDVGLVIGEDGHERRFPPW